MPLREKRMRMQGDGMDAPSFTGINVPKWKACNHPFTRGSALNDCKVLSIDLAKNSFQSSNWTSTDGDSLAGLSTPPNKMRHLSYTITQLRLIFRNLPSTAWSPVYLEKPEGSKNLICEPFLKFAVEFCESRKSVIDSVCTLRCTMRNENTFL